ncbi:MAG: polysaccharide biosynthesis tyrosine autokinase [Actinomycetota bacterium]|nr:polysaccharide biosynthesis tyrosine autokinase [Actinomycetota bacterium]
MSTPAHLLEPPYAHGRATPLREYLAVLRARKWWIAVVTLVAVGSGLFFSYRQTPIYEAQSRVLVTPVNMGSSQSSPGQAPNLETQRELVGSLVVADRVATELELDASASELLRDLSVSVAPNTEILVIRYAHPSAEEARRRAQAFADAYLGFRQEQAADQLAAAAEPLETQLNDLEQQLFRLTERLADEEDPERRARMEAKASRIQSEMDALQAQLSALANPADLRVGEIVAPALTPTSPARPRHGVNGVLSLALGLALGVGLAFVRERLDDSLRGREDLENRVQAPVLSIVPKIAGWRRRDTPLLAAIEQPQAAASEAYRKLRTGLLFMASQRPLQTILITSANPGEGKTATAANLAVVLAQAGKRVILISADLRKPRIHRFFATDNSEGLTDILIGEGEPLNLVVETGIPSLRVLPSGPVPGNPAELLSSERMARLLDDLRDAADFVILDAAPVLAVTDAMVLAPFVDSVLFIADGENTSASAVTQARNQLRHVRANVDGAVLNNVDLSRGHGAYEYYETYVYEYVEEPNGHDARRSRRASRTR